MDWHWGPIFNSPGGPGGTMDKQAQRGGSKSNIHASREFELKARRFLLSQGLNLKFNIMIPIGIDGTEKEHAFDLGCTDTKVLVECKSHKWTKPGYNAPSSKLAAWNEAMFYFHLAPDHYRKIMFVLKDYNEKRNETLASYYLKTYGHLVPSDVEFWEYDEEKEVANHIRLP